MPDNPREKLAGGIDDLSFVPNLVGIHGQIGHGKDTFCKNLEKYREVRHMSFANPLKESLQKILGGDLKHYFGTQADKACPLPQFWLDRLQMGWESLHPEQAHNSTKWKTYREALQLFGTEVGRNLIASNIWVWAVEWRIVEGYLSGEFDENDLIVFADVRFDNEAEAILNWGGNVFRIVNTNLEDEVEDLVEHSLPGAKADDFSSHVSEKILPPHLLTRTYLCRSVDDNARAAAETIWDFYKS